MAHGHDDHHGHHGHHGNETKKSLIISAVVIVAFVGGTYGLVQQGTAARNAEVGSSSSVAPQQHQAATRAAPSPAHQPHAAPSSDEVDRANFAKNFHDGQRRHNFTLSARATGPKKTVFEVSWPTKADDGKIDELKKATRLHAAARARGFKKFVVRVGANVVWSTAL